jgi:drug/metabolite transporter (DMT)-like permease
MGIGFSEFIFIIVVGVIALAGFGFWLIMLIHSLNQKDQSEKIVWSIGIIVTGIVGSLIYYFWKYKQESTKIEAQ